MATIKKQPGYIQKKKKKNFVIGLIFVISMLVIYFSALTLSGTNKTYFTVFAVLLAIPAAQSIVAWITAFPYQDVSKEQENKINHLPDHICVFFSNLLSDGRKFAYFEYILIVKDKIYFCNTQDLTEQKKQAYRKVANHIFEKKGFRLAVECVFEKENEKLLQTLQRSKGEEPPSIDEIEKIIRQYSA